MSLKISTETKAIGAWLRIIVGLGIEARFISFPYQAQIAYKTINSWILNKSFFGIEGIREVDFLQTDMVCLKHINVRIVIE
ncbi:hypothetical protein D3C85_1306520 [compost metagenome]